MAKNRNKKKEEKYDEEETRKKLDKLDAKLKDQKKTFNKILKQVLKTILIIITKSIIMKTFLPIMIGFILFPGIAFGQNILLNTVSSSGHYNKSPDNHLSWNLGETCIDSWFHSGGALTEGFFQNFQLILDTEDDLPLLELQVFPNPFEQEIFVKVSDAFSSPAELLLFDLNAKLLFRKKIEEKMLPVDMSQYPFGTYVIAILDNKNNLRAYQKIIKIIK